MQPNAPGTQGYNRYSYVANNPTTWIDPTGHAAAAAGAIAAPVLSPFWLPIVLFIAAFFIADCAAGSPFGVCFALAAFVITALVVIACVLGGFGGACWTSEYTSLPLPLNNPNPWWEGNRKWEVQLPWIPDLPIPFTDEPDNGTLYSRWERAFTNDGDEIPGGVRNLRPSEMPEGLHREKPSLREGGAWSFYVDREGNLYYGDGTDSLKPYYGNIDDWED